MNDDEQKLPPGVRKIVRPDGITELTFSKRSGVTEEVLARIVADHGGTIRPIGKRTSIAWVPMHNETERVTRAREIQKLGDLILGHVKSGAINSVASKDVGKYMDLCADEISRRIEEAREAGFEVGRIVASAEATTRAKSGYAKAEKSGMQAAKEEAKRLWPEANRKGWNAERLWTELRNKGHKVKSDTVRKWLTKLRKTGMC